MSRHRNQCSLVGYIVSSHRTYGHVDAAEMQKDECKNCV